MKILSNNDIWVPAKTAAFRQIGGEVVIVDTMHNHIMTLNETGSELWRMLDGRTLEKLVESMTQLFDVSLSEAKLDATEFLVMLDQKGLVVCNPSTNVDK